jgi:hypothetical protein
MRQGAWCVQSDVRFGRVFIVLPIQNHIPEGIYTIDDAKLIFHIVETECHQCEEGLQSALANTQEAYRRVCEAEDQMVQADMRIGKVRYIIKKSGFSTVLQPRGRKTQPLVLGIRSTFPLFLTTLLTPYSLVDEHIVHVDGGTMSVILD